MTMTIEQIQDLEYVAADNGGHCDRCLRTIKIYRYKINRSHCIFLRAMAEETIKTGANFVDISAIGLPYSIRTQVTKMRLHGLIAQVKTEGEKQARKWLITTKGWRFLNGKAIQETVVVFNNQVLGHDGKDAWIHEVMGEAYDPSTPKYEEAPVNQPEARVYSDVRQPKVSMKFKAKYIAEYPCIYIRNEIYDIEVDRLQMGKPVLVNSTGVKEFSYVDIAEFQRHWKIIKE